MAKTDLRILLSEQLKLAEASKSVLKESYDRVSIILKSKKSNLDVSERESLEAFTARFSRFSDFLIQRLFRTIDQIELVDEGSILDRFSRFEKRGIVPLASDMVEIRQLRNEISHEYLIESSDAVLAEAFSKADLLFSVFENLKEYITKKIDRLVGGS